MKSLCIWTQRYQDNQRTGKKLAGHLIKGSRKGGLEMDKENAAATYPGECPTFIKWPFTHVSYVLNQL